MNHKVLKELIAEQIHNLWWNWSRNIAKSEKLSEERLNRWKKLWVPYNELSEEMRDIDRRLSQPILQLIQMYIEKGVVK